jgi:hypothetical protein
VKTPDLTALVLSFRTSYQTAILRIGATCMQCLRQLLQLTGSWSIVVHSTTLNQLWRLNICRQSVSSPPGLTKSKTWSVINSWRVCPAEANFLFV